MSTYDIVIKSGIVVSPTSIDSLDIGIKDGKIAVRARDLPTEGVGRVIDASGLFVLPGALDPHYHPQYGDNLAQGSIVAAHGGITTLVPFIYAYQGLGVGQAIDEFMESDGSQSVLDFGGHVAVLEPEVQIPQLQEAFDRGITSFKMFMAYRRRGMMAEDDMLLGAMEFIGRAGGMTMVHAENGLGVDYLEQKFQTEGKVSIEWFERSRPKAFEYEAVNRAIHLASIAESPLYLVHQTTGEAVPLIGEARNRGQFVVGETCPQYLTHTKDILIEQGPLAICTPPYREEWDVDSLWAGLASGAMSTIGSDHSPHPRETKLQDNVFKTPVGTPQVETMLSVVFQRGVVEGRLTLQRFVSVMCENPARIFGLYPKKGTLQVGADADVVLIDPRRNRRVEASALHSSVDYNTYEGMELVGTPVHTLQRGRDVLVNGELQVAPGDGDHVPVGPGVEKPI
jgi:dihydropyrimidinase